MPNDVSKIIEDAAVLYNSNGFVYIHNNRNNFAQYVGEASQVLISKKNEVISAWRRQSKVLMQECDRNESRFFNNMSKDFAGEQITRQTFLEKYKSVAEKPTVQMQNLITNLSKFKSGKKSIAMLQEIGAQVQQIETLVSSLNLESEVSDSTINKLKPLLEGIKKFNNAIDTMKKRTNFDSQSTKLSKVAQRHVGALSLGKITNEVLPAVMEAIVHSSFRDMLKESISKDLSKAAHAGKQTNTGTSADETFFSAGFSVKLDRSKEKDILQQQKSRQLTTFFNLNEELETNTSLAGANATIFRDENIIHSIQYVLANSKMLGLETSMMSEIWSLLIIANLNEKVFGFNKTYQTDLTAIVQNMPIAIISSKGVAWTKDLVVKLLNTVDLNFNNLATAYTPVVGDATSILQELYTEKIKTIESLKANNTPITYANIKAAADGNLRSLMEQIIKNISITIQYYIPVKEIMNEYGF